MTKSHLEKGEISSYIAGLPLTLLSVPPAIYESEPGHVNALRSIDVLGIPDFFDHSGNCVDGVLAAWAITKAGIMVAGDRIPEDKQPAFVIGASALVAGGAIGVNVAYEAGVKIPPYEQKPADAPFDGPDALFGGAAGTIVAATFCYSALRSLRKSRAKNKDEVSTPKTVASQN